MKLSIKPLARIMQKSLTEEKLGPQSWKDAHISPIALKHDDVRDHNKPDARCIAGELRGPAVEADGKQAVRNALAVVY